MVRIKAFIRAFTPFFNYNTREMFDLTSIKKHGNYWQARVDYYDYNHKRHFKNKSGFTTKSEAQVWATEKEN